MPKNCMSGYNFELWVQGLLTSMGFNAKTTRGNDNGVDIIATFDKQDYHLKYYIQCKFHNRPVGKMPVQEVYTGCRYFGNDGYPVVITNNRMSSENGDHKCETSSIYIIIRYLEMIKTEYIEKLAETLSNV